MLCALGQHAEAKEAFKAAIQAVPQHVEVGGGCSSIVPYSSALLRAAAWDLVFKLASSGNCAHACADSANVSSSQCLRALPRQAHFNLGNVFRQCGHFEAAVYCYETVTDAVPGHWRGLLSLAVAHMGLGHTAEAQRHLRAAFQASGASLLFSDPQHA